MVATLVDCCAHADSGDAAAPPNRVTKSRRFIASPRPTKAYGNGLNRLAGSGQREAEGCPLWVKSGHRRMSASCPLYPRKQTLLKVISMSALCQKQTNCAATCDYKVVTRRPR